MTTDPTLSYHPTESLVLPTKRRFFPFKIPNFHQQLRHYISTTDSDRIYVVVDRVVYAIHISRRKRETIAVIPFEPKCLAAGFGWIGIGGTVNGECAFVRLSDQNAPISQDTPAAAQSADVDSALPFDLESPLRTSPRILAGTEQTASGSGSPSQLPEVQLHKFGGSIVNSVTIHRLAGDEKGFLDEDVAVLSNNDKTVTIYSLTRSKVLAKLGHSTCMNYAVISPDSTLLAAVGDENRAYFYRVTRDVNNISSTDAGEKLSGWKLVQLLCTEMDIGTRMDDKCCFTIAFSQSNRLCAIGSQSGVITVFDVKTIQNVGDTPCDKDPIICHFNSSRDCCTGGAVRCMSFSPEPWDLLVWLEDKGRAGIADVRQAFIRRQILQLDMNEPGLEQIHTEPMIGNSAGLALDLDSHSLQESRHDLDARALLDSVEGLAGGRLGESSDTLPLRESLIQDLTERERLIVEFLNTARWASRLEDGLTDRLARANTNYSHPHSGSRARPLGLTSGANRPSRPTSPRPVILSQSNYEAGNQTANAGSSTPDPQPSLTLSWTASPAELQSATLDNSAHTVDSTSSSEQESSSNESGTASRPRGTVTSRPTANFDYSSTTPSLLPRPRNHQRSRSAHRRPERLESTNLDIPPSLRANIVAVERLRRQRQLVNEVETQNRNHPRDYRYMQQPAQPTGLDHLRSPRWIRSVMNDMPERSMAFGRRDLDPSSSAGLGWGADGRTLYIATVSGIFEYQINVVDRKTFPVITYR